MARPSKSLSLDPSVRAELQAILRAGTTPMRLAQRAEIVLLFDQGRTAEQIAATTKLSYNAVCRWRHRFEDSPGS